MAINIPSISALKNRGIPVQVHILRKYEDGRFHQPYEREFIQGPDGEVPAIETVWIKFSNGVLADMEEAPPFGFGGIEGWQEQLDNSPYRTLVHTLALALELFIARPGTGDLMPDTRRAAKMMMDDDAIDEYAAAFGAALTMSQGMKPELVADFLKRGIEATVEARQEAMKVLHEGLDEMDEASTTETGSGDGSPADAATKSSGPSVRRKSPSTSGRRRVSKPEKGASPT